MTGKSRCEMRGCVYISTQMLCDKTFSMSTVVGIVWSEGPKLFSWLIFSQVSYSHFWDVATCSGTPKNKLDEPTSFFFFRSFHFFSFLLVARALLVLLTAPFMCLPRVFIFVSLDLCWTKRMTEKFLWETLWCVINLDASMKKSQVESLFFVCHSVSGEATITSIETYTLYFYGMRDSCQRIVWDVATCCGTLHSQHDEPMTSFSRSPVLFFSSRVACLVVLPIGPSRACKWIIYHFCLRRLVLNKTHGREIALWNARMRIYFDAKFQFCVLYTRQGPT